MRRITDRFHDAMHLQPAETFKIFMFVLNAVAAMAYLFVLGQLTVLGGMTSTLWLIVVLAAVLDLVPEIVTVRMLQVLPDAARKAEQLQLLLTAAAYLLLVSIATGTAPSVLWAYSGFTVLWISAFLVEQSAMFLVDDPTSG